MKSIFLSLIAITTISFSAKAQENNTGKTENVKEQRKEYKHEHHRFHHQQMAEKLNLTGEQKQKLESINADFKNRVEELKKENITQQELKEKRQTLAKERTEKVQALLTPEQKTQIEQFRKEGKGDRSMNSGKRLGKMKSTLDLTDEQVAKLKAQKESFKSKAEAIKNNESLTADQKKDQLKVLRDEKRNSFKSILTSDQLKKLEEMKHDRPARTS
jgi:Spy/CpxP family protein refolding chaperone